MGFQGILNIFLLLMIVNPQLRAQMVIGEWCTHLPYSEAQNVTEVGSRIFCATTGGLFYYDKQDNTINKFTKVDGLSDVEISCINYSKQQDMLVIAYKNANVDLIQGNEIFNISDIKRKQLPANKTINSIMFLDQDAYLSCGFGIVVINLEKKEIKDTYLIGENSSYKFVYDFTTDGEYFYAATETGIYKADMNSPNLIDFNYWHRIQEIPNCDKTFNNIVSFNGNIYANYFCEEESNVDTIYKYNGNNWSEFRNFQMNRTRSMEVNYNHLVIVSYWHTDVYDQNEKNIRHYFVPDPEHSILDIENYIWVADERDGLIRIDQSGNKEYFKPNGPISARAVTLRFADQKLFVAAGGDKRSWSNLWNHAEANVLANDVWDGFREINYKDVVDIAVDPVNSNHFYAATWGYGLLDINNLEITGVFDENNSTIQNALTTGPYKRLGGVVFDANRNLWMTNAEVPDPVSVMMADGRWKSFAFQRKVGDINLGRIIITSNDHKWIQLPGGNGLFAFDVNGTIENETDDRFMKFDIVDINGKIITNNVYCLTEDTKGNIWVGTDKGVVVYYNPYRVFDTDLFYGQQIIVPRNDGTGLADILLGTETVTAITVDGANRKWIGTSKAGAFLLSEDGLEQIHNFTLENSPLLSNNIMDIAINGKTGEVYFATDKGLISYKSTATDANEYFSDVYVYPNPVREDYNGDIVISGLIEDTNIKITDISGNIVFETTSLGGQAIWDGRSFSGNKVHTGVYLIFCTNEDGSKTHVTKLLIIN